jgi:hypothetical protein
MFNKEMKMITDDNTPVFYVPGRPGIIDLAIERDGVMRGGYSNESLDEMDKRYPGVQLGKLGPVAAASEDMFRSPPQPISEERFREMLEVLPPQGWHSGDGAESFKLCERTSGSITAIFCRIGDRYFEMQDSFTLPHNEIVTRCAGDLRSTRQS